MMKREGAFLENYQQHWSFKDSDAPTNLYWGILSLGTLGSAETRAASIREINTSLIWSLKPVSDT